MILRKTLFLSEWNSLAFQTVFWSASRIPMEVGSVAGEDESPRASSSGGLTTASEEGAEPHERPTPVECAVCSELSENNVLFEPCGHRIACEDCAARMKKCLKCSQSVVKRTTKGKQNHTARFIVNRK